MYLVKYSTKMVKFVVTDSPSGTGCTRTCSGSAVIFLAGKVALSSIFRYGLETSPLSISGIVAEKLP